MMVCCSNETHRTSDKSTHVTNKKIWANSNEENTDTNIYTIENTLGVVDDTSFQYSKRGRCRTEASAAPISHQQHPILKQMTAWQHIIQANSLHKLLMANTIFNTIKLKKVFKYASSDSGIVGHFLVN